MGDLSDAGVSQWAHAVTAVIPAALTKGTVMPLINVKVMENVLTADQKQDVASRFTDAFAAVVGEPARALTWVVIEDMTSGQLVVGGEAITTEAINGLLAAEPATAGAR